MAKIHSINGPIVSAIGGNFFVSEIVKVSRLIGEVVSLDSELAFIQVYENTAGLSPGMEVNGGGTPMCVTMQPGIIGGMFDGIMRPLTAAKEKKHDFIFLVKSGQALAEGQVYATLQETEFITYKATVPPGVSGTVSHITTNGEVHLTCGKKISPAQTWPIRKPRPVKKILPKTTPLITGQRVVDSLFPLAKGGTAAIPGEFGSGKTILQQQIAKYCDADIIVYIGCGERGNEMAEVLEEFSHLKDPKTGRPLMERTVFIANTSDMPVAAREASIYTGITVAEFYRDMGYHVALMADSTSRWAEALRELSARMREIPAEEGYPAYLSTRISDFYSRAGLVTTLGGETGSITIIGAVSPQGGDFSEPVTRYTKRNIECYWALDRQLAYARHFPAINWTESYSNYPLIPPGVAPSTKKTKDILQEEKQLLEIGQLIGFSSLTKTQQDTLAVAKNIRENFLKQNALDPADAFMPLAVQFALLEKCLWNI